MPTESPLQTLFSNPIVWGVLLVVMTGLGLVAWLLGRFIVGSLSSTKFGRTV